MAATKEAELVTAVLLYALRCHAEGDRAALAAMDFGPREVQALAELSLADLAWVGKLKVHCLRIGLDREVFWPLLAHLRREREAEGLQQALIAADAPLEMMRALYGLSGREHTRLRVALGVPLVAGRPPEPDEAVAECVWEAWSARCEQAGTTELPPAAYLALQEQTGASLRAVWSLTRRWQDEGRGPTPPAPGTAAPRPAP